MPRHCLLMVKTTSKETLAPLTLIELKKLE
ncbi:hypothetical protein NGUA07_03589 [Salmonella enterica]|nr:hypothetical protein NGUA07_03589 [Salmonella enterica]